MSEVIKDILHGQNEIKQDMFISRQNQVSGKNMREVKKSIEVLSALLQKDIEGKKANLDESNGPRVPQPSTGHKLPDNISRESQPQQSQSSSSQVSMEL